MKGKLQDILVEVEDSSADAIDTVAEDSDTQHGYDEAVEGVQIDIDNYSVHPFQLDGLSSDEIRAFLKGMVKVTTETMSRTPDDQDAIDVVKACQDESEWFLAHPTARTDTLAKRVQKLNVYAEPRQARYVARMARVSKEDAL